MAGLLLIVIAIGAWANYGGPTPFVNSAPTPPVVAGVDASSESRATTASQGRSSYWEKGRSRSFSYGDYDKPRRRKPFAALMILAWEGIESLFKD